MILSTKTIDLHKVSGTFPFDHDNGGSHFGSQNIFGV